MFMCKSIEEKDKFEDFDAKVFGVITAMERHAVMSVGELGIQPGSSTDWLVLRDQLTQDTLPSYLHVIEARTTDFQSVMDAFEELGKIYKTMTNAITTINRMCNLTRYSGYHEVQGRIKRSSVRIAQKM
jgi:hypothetical protein